VANLPTGFEDLAPFVDKWAMGNFDDRYRARVISQQAEIAQFYNALLPRMDAIMSYLDDFELGALPEDTELLNNLAMSFMTVAPAVELFRQPLVPYGFDWSRLSVIEHI
jgi:hypothetical protein